MSFHKGALALAAAAAVVLVGATLAQRRIDSSSEGALKWIPDGPHGEALGVSGGCQQTLAAGSKSPFPETGPIELSAGQQMHAKTRQAFLYGPKGSGFAQASNEGSVPASIVFVGEDGLAKARLFIRAGQKASASLPAGAYDAYVQTGRDWDGSSFWRCSAWFKAKGVVVVEPGLGSKLLTLDSGALVLANRIDPKVSALIDAEESKAAAAKLQEVKAVEASLGQSLFDSGRTGRPPRGDRP